MWRCLLAVAVLGLCAVPAVASTSLGGAHLTLVKTRPVTVDGTGFNAGERIELVLRGPRGRSRENTHARADGTFNARFDTNAESRCAGFSITASGSAGSRARFLRRMPVACD